MGKVRSKAKGKRRRKQTRKLVDRLKAGQKKKADVTVNPFELHINRLKHNVIGRKSKHDKGLPGIARNKAEKKRKETLLRDYVQRNKSNVLLDRRIGETDSTMSLEAKMAARFTVERQIMEENKLIKSKNLLNLGAEDKLTHYGQSLAEIEKFDDPRSDEDDEDQELGENLLRTMSGGLLSMKGKGEGETSLSRQERIDALIAESKHKKLERQLKQEESHNLTEKLDAEWKDVFSLMQSKDKVRSVEVPIDSYDKLVKELLHEKRATPTDKLKSEKELAVIEEKKLHKLEEERIARMRSKEKPLIPRNHRSADALEDDYVIETETKLFSKGDLDIQYEDGILTIPDNDLMIRKEEEHENASDKSEEKSEEESGDDEDDESEDEDNFSDLESDGEGDTLQETISSKKNVSVTSTAQKLSTSVKLDDVPETVEEWKSLIAICSSESQSAVIKRILECNHPKLLEGNKQKLQKFFRVLLEYLCASMVKEETDLEVADQYLPYLYDLMQFSPEEGADSILQIINEKRENYRKGSIQCLSGIQSTYPEMDTLILFKVIPHLFPTSDFRHKVVTPVMLFMAQILTECSVKSEKDVKKGLFICSQFYHYVSLSKRLVPEVLNYLTGIISLGVTLSLYETQQMQILPPFKVDIKPFLRLEKPEINRTLALESFKLSHLTRGDNEMTDKLRSTAMWLCLELLVAFGTLYEDLPSFHDLFVPIQAWWKKLPLQHYQDKIKVAVKRLDSTLQTRHLLAPLMRDRKRPQSIKFFEPKIEANFAGQKQKKVTNGKSKEESRLQHKVKREFKGALRELRRDNHFLAKHQLEQQMERDAERKRKVKQIYGELSGQEGEYRKLMKKRRRKK